MIVLKQQKTLAQYHVLNSKVINVVSVNKNICIGCGACVSVCPDGFQIGSDGKSQAKPGAEKLECVEAAASGCPVQAITV